MFSVIRIEVMLLKAAFPYSRGRCCVVANYLEVSFRAIRHFIHTAVKREKKCDFISYECNVQFQSVFLWGGL